MPEIWSTVMVPAFAVLFVVIDPIGLVPMFLALSDKMTSQVRRQTAWRAIVLGFFVLLVFAVFGKSALNFLGISLPAFRIAGGILLFVLALEMLFEKRTERRARNVRDSDLEAARAASDDPDATSSGGLDDQWVFPLGIPLIAGPGAITSIILLMSSHADKVTEQLAVVAVLTFVLAMTLSFFLLADRLKKHISPTATRAMSRILGMILAALAVQFVLTGLKSAGFA